MNDSIPPNASTGKVTRMPRRLASWEQRRVSVRLRTVERGLRRIPGSAARTKALDDFDDYIRVGEFPKNRTRMNHREPALIDEAGTVCAVGHILVEAGHRAPVEALARLDNHARVREIGDSGFDAALASTGLSRAEAALIQPSYGYCCSDTVSSALSGVFREALLVPYLVLMFALTLPIEMLSIRARLWLLQHGARGEGLAVLLIAAKTVFFALIAIVALALATQTF